MWISLHGAVYPCDRPAYPLAMLLVVSPAKAMNFVSPKATFPVTRPRLADDIAALDKVTRKLRPRDLKRLMALSDNLADLNHARFQAFDPAMEDGLQAAFAFNGDVYAGLSARTLDRPALDWAQGHLRILSGLYGLLRPYDAIQAYRLEMGTALKSPRGKSLYAFWGDRLAQALNADAQGHADSSLINLASQEYFGAVDRKALILPLITCHFREEQEGELRTISFYAKRARGMMARYAVERRAETPDALKDFQIDGYGFRPEVSTDADWVFARPYVPAAAKRAA